MTQGTYGGGTFGTPWGIGGGLYIDSHGRIYPQFYSGTPRFSFSAGYTPNLEELLTGFSISGSPGAGQFRSNIAGNTNTLGVGFGTPGVGVTYGVGPLELSSDYSQPWKAPYIRESAAAAGLPSRYNVWEYDYPESSPEEIAAAKSSSISSHFAPSLPGAFNDPDFAPSLAGGLGTAGQGAEAPLRGLAKHFADILANPGQAAAPAWPGSQDSAASYFGGANANLFAATNGSTSSDAAGNYPRLTSRLASQPRSVFDTGASAVPFAPASQSFSRPGVASVTQPLPTSPPGAPLGLFSGEPMPNWPARLPIFDFPDRSANSNDASDDAPGSGARGTGIPMLDQYIRYINQLYGG